jgi:hypothetical protein
MSYFVDSNASLPLCSASSISNRTLRYKVFATRSFSGDLAKAQSIRPSEINIKPEFFTNLSVPTNISGNMNGEILEVDAISGTINLLNFNDVPSGKIVVVVVVYDNRSTCNNSKENAFSGPCHSYLLIEINKVSLFRCPSRRVFTFIASQGPQEKFNVSLDPPEIKLYPEVQFQSNLDTSSIGFGEYTITFSIANNTSPIKCEMKVV